MMSAIILVLNTSYFTRPAGDGRFHIDGVSPGTYEIHVFDERATNSPVQMPVITLTQGEESASAPPIDISEAAYAPAPHRNKYGQDYPAGAGSESYSYSTIPQ
jgi:hypothetical protein